MLSYEEMLDRAYKLMPPIVFEKKRFEVPKVQVSVEGNKTIFKNAKEIADYLRRDIKHMLKFIGKDMGAAWRIDGNRVIFVGKFSGFTLNQKVDRYVKTYVICPVCGKPDTKLVKVDRVLVLKCMACGAMSPVPSL